MGHEQLACSLFPIWMGWRMVGITDELRWYKSRKSYQWIAADYKNGIKTFSTLGTPENP